MTWAICVFHIQDGGEHIWSRAHCPCIGLHDLHFKTHPYFCHTQATWAQDHHCWKNGDSMLLWHIFELSWRRKYYFTTTHFWWCGFWVSFVMIVLASFTDERCVLLPLLPECVADSLWCGHTSFDAPQWPPLGLGLQTSSISPLPPHLWTDTPGGNRWWVIIHSGCNIAI